MKFIFHYTYHGETGQTEQFVSLLLKYGANASLTDNDGKTILHLYAHHSRILDTRFVKLLTEAGAEINKTRDDSPETPLGIAAKNYSQNLKGRSNIKALLENGADPTYKTQREIP